MLDKFYPEHEITVTSTDTPYLTPTVKAMLRRKNRLMHAGRTDEAEAIAARVRTTRSSSRWLRTIDTRKNAKCAWAKVREIIKGLASRDTDQVDGLTAQSLNNHYAAISTDSEYRAPRPKLTAFGDLCLITEATVFRMLDILRATATGLDQIPVWFLHLGAPVFAAPLAHLFDQSLTTGVVPRQWRTAVISPIPKTASPAQASDFRPISITPLSGSSSARIFTQRYSSRVRRSTSVTSLRPDRPARRRLLLWRCCTPSAQ